MNLLDRFCRASAASLRRSAEKVRERVDALNRDTSEDVFLSIWLSGMAYGLEVASYALEGEEVAA